MKQVLGITYSLLITFFCTAQEEDIKAAKTPISEIPDCSKKEELIQTKHRVTIGGKQIEYLAVAGNYILKDEKCNPTGSIFFVSYTKENPDPSEDRPITFCFNGGPGSSSVWLHLGLLGPKRVQLNENGKASPPYRFIENEFSLLDETDLVFIDPISTGYSRAILPYETKQFHGYTEDIKSVAEFIRIYLTQNKRWDSPKFIAGESYGTTRAAGLAAHLLDEHYIYVNGLILISTILNFQCVDFEDGNDLPYLLFLPTYTASAWYHKKLSPELQENFLSTIQAAREFVIDDYARALFKGALLTPLEKQQVLENLSKFTGLSVEYIDRCNLRVASDRFRKELLRNQEETLGRFDSRFKGVDVDAAGECPEYDPSAAAIFGAFTATMNQYLLTDLEYKKESEYKILTNVFPWDYGNKKCYFNVSDTLRSVMTKNGNLRVFVANGYYDLATPFFETEYTFNHLGLRPQFQNHVTMKYYDGGHMMYIEEPILKQMKEDLTNYYRKTRIDQTSARFHLSR